MIYSTAQIRLSDIIAKVNSHLAMIGKIQKNLDFADVVVTSSQEGVVKDYCKEALKKIVSYCHPCLQGYDMSPSDDIFNFKYRDSLEAGKFSVESVTECLVSYCVYHLLFSKGIEVYSKYKEEYELCFSSLVENIMHPSGVYSDVSERLSGTTGSCV